MKQLGYFCCALFTFTSHTVFWSHRAPNFAVLRNPSVDICIVFSVKTCNRDALLERDGTYWTKPVYVLMCAWGQSAWNRCAAALSSYVCVKWKCFAHFLFPAVVEELHQSYCMGSSPVANNDVWTCCMCLKGLCRQNTSFGSFGRLPR